MNRSIHVIVLFLLFTAFLSAQSNTPAIGNPALEQNKIIEEIKVFPNPAIDYIQISTGSAIIKKVVITNIFGKEVKVFQHYNNAQHDISDLKPGLYIIRMLDEKNKIMRSLKFNKNFDGA